MDEDLEYIKRFKEGDLGGFEMLVKKYQNRALNIAYSLALNFSSAQDIAQEAFIKVYNNIALFRAESKFSSWLYRIVVNCSYDYLRKNKHQSIPLDDAIAVKLEYDAKTQDPFAKELVHWALSKIPLEYRSAVVLREIEGLSYEDISRALKIGIGTVESRIFRGRQLLREALLKRGVLKDAV